MFFNSCYYFMTNEKLTKEVAPKKRKKMIKANCGGQDETNEKIKPCKVNLTCADCNKSIVHICNKNKSCFSPCGSEDNR